jgi:hypothetical protein
MDKQTANQTYHLILSDIAMAAAIRTHDPANAVVVAEEDYLPGVVRDAWFEQVTDDTLRQKVSAMATAGVASLSALAPEQISRAAATFGVPLAFSSAEEMVEHFTIRREAVLRYRR